MFLEYILMVRIKHEHLDFLFLYYLEQEMHGENDVYKTIYARVTFIFLQKSILKFNKFFAFANI